MEGEKICVKIGDWFSIEVAPTERGLLALVAALNVVKIQPRDALDALIVDDAPVTKSHPKSPTVTEKKTRAPWGSKSGKRKGRTAAKAAPNKEAAKPNAHEEPAEHDSKDKEKLLKFLGKGDKPIALVIDKLWPDACYGTGYTRMTKLLKDCPEVAKNGRLLVLKGAAAAAEPDEEEEKDVAPEEKSDEGEDEPRRAAAKAEYVHSNLNMEEASDLAVLLRGWLGRPFTANDLIETAVVNESVVTSLFEDFSHNEDAFQASLKKISNKMKCKLIASLGDKDGRDAMVITRIGGMA